MGLAPQGALSSLVLGQAGSFSGINLNQGYNNRLQPATIRAWSTNPTTPVALDLAYTFDLSAANTVCQSTLTTPTNNGDVAVITNNLSTARKQTFCYDALNRISSATKQRMVAELYLRYLGELKMGRARGRFCAVRPRRTRRRTPSKQELLPHLVPALVFLRFLLYLRRAPERQALPQKLEQRRVQAAHQQRLSLVWLRSTLVLQFTTALRATSYIRAINSRRTDQLSNQPLRPTVTSTNLSEEHQQRGIR